MESTSGNQQNQPNNKLGIISRDNEKGTSMLLKVAVAGAKMRSRKKLRRF
jgi:hypothetical protein